MGCRDTFTLDVNSYNSHTHSVIQSFADKRTAALFLGEAAKNVSPAVRRRAEAKLMMLHQARSLNDLRVPPANRLKALKGDRVGQYSIRINDQWRLCFRWRNGDAYDVEFVDYH